MSVASEITRLQGAKADIKTAIEAKGVTVPSATTLDGYSALIAQISGGGGGGLEYESGTYTPTSDIARATINFTNTHTVPPAIVNIFDCSETATYPSSNSNVSMTYVDMYRLYGSKYLYSQKTTEYRYAVVNNVYYGTSLTNLSIASTFCLYNSDNTGDGSNSYSRYFAKPNCFYPYTGSSRYWKANRTYKWIAIWK